jgi:hypothetical protein
MAREQSVWCCVIGVMAMIAGATCVIVHTCVVERLARAAPIDASAAASPTDGRRVSEPATASEERNGKEARAPKHLSLRLDSNDNARKLIADFPDMSGVTYLDLESVRIEAISDELLEQVFLHGKSIEALHIAVLNSAGDRRPRISDDGMEYISRLPKLKQLCLACWFSAEGFQHVSKLRRLRVLGCDYATITVKQLFEVLAELPELRTVGVRHADFSQPIDAETHRAIASLNGRLESLSFGEWQETKVHASLLPAIAEIKSLTWLDLGEVCGSTPRGVSYYLEQLPYLEHLTPSWDEVVAMRRFDRRETYPIEFRPVTSASGMMALLNCLLGWPEAAKVRREVVRRRAGLSDLSEDFTKSKLPVTQILSDSFGVSFRYVSTRWLTFIEFRYPELDAQIRRYLSGMDLEPAAK